MKSANEEFIERLNLIYKGSLDFSEAIYLGNKKKLKAICPKHGAYWRSANNFLQGVKCKQCALESTYGMSSEAFIEKANLIHNNKYLYLPTKPVLLKKDKITINCKVHGDFIQEVSRHLGGRGCTSCGYIEANKNRKYSLNDFIEAAEAFHGNKYDYSKVKFNWLDDKVIIGCPKHGEFEQMARTHCKIGRGCRLCTYESTTCDMVSKYRNNPSLGKDEGVIYILNISSDRESFLKLGISSNFKLRDKIYKKELKLYKYSLVKTFPMTNLETAISEKKILKHLRDVGLQYKPSFKFTGSGECFPVLALDYISDLIENGIEDE